MYVKPRCQRIASNTWLTCSVPWKLLNLITTRGSVLYAMAATWAAEALSTSLLITALTNRFVLSQFVRPILPDESMINAISKRGLHSLSKQKYYTKRKQKKWTVKKHKERRKCTFRIRERKSKWTWNNLNVYVAPIMGNKIHIFMDNINIAQCQIALRVSAYLGLLWS